MFNVPMIGLPQPFGFRLASVLQRLEQAALIDEIVLLDYPQVWFRSSYHSLELRNRSFNPMVNPPIGPATLTPWLRYFGSDRYMFERCM